MARRGADMFLVKHFDLFEGHLKFGVMRDVQPGRKPAANSNTHNPAMTMIPMASPDLFQIRCRQIRRFTASVRESAPN